jgi:TetR/AcrR family transcriptional repressor of nem operon
MEGVLERATLVFWTRGFKHTSLDDLCGATGLNRSSLYAAFGRKRDLYLRALARYEDRSAARIEEALAGRPIRAGLADFLDELIDAIVEGPGRRGCFIGNCAAELARLDRTAAARVRRSLARIEGCFHAALDRAKMRGELPQRADPRALARFITIGIQGLRVYGKANADRATLQGVSTTLVKCLDL